MMDTKELFSILPNNIRVQLESTANLRNLQELRLRVNKPLILIVESKEVVKNYNVTREDVKIIIQRISNYSVYAFEEDIKKGFITIKGGHRVGISGDCVMENEKIKTIKNISSLNIRFSRQVLNCSNKVIPFIANSERIYNTVIISPPKCGKTTMLRDIARNLSHGVNSLNLLGKKVTIIDERSEIAACFEGVPQVDVGIRTDVYDNCLKSYGIMMAIRSMSPEVIICDEIGAEEDMESILMATNSGVNIITSIHGFDIEDLKNKLIYKKIMDNLLFHRAIVLSNRKGVGTIEYIYDFKRNERIGGING